MGREVGWRGFQAVHTSGIGRQILSARVEALLKWGEDEEVGIERF